jgi:hypothetical protein
LGEEGRDEAVGGGSGEEDCGVRLVVVCHGFERMFRASWLRFDRVATWFGTVAGVLLE